MRHQENEISMSKAQLGAKGLALLKKNNNITHLVSTSGTPLISNEVDEKLREAKSESEVIALIMPHLRKCLTNGPHILLNSESLPWPTSHDVANEFGLKPDFCLSTLHFVVLGKNPISSTVRVQEARKADTALASGVPASWFVSGDACEPFEAKLDIATPDVKTGNEGFGDLITYCRSQSDAIRQRNKQRKSQGHPELVVPDQLRGMLVGRSHFWLMEFCPVTNWPSSLCWGKFTDAGTSSAIASFFQPLPWHLAVCEAFRLLDVEAESSGGMFLGEGAMARVFSATKASKRVAVKVIALKTLSSSSVQRRILSQLEKDHALLVSLGGKELPIVQVISEKLVIGDDSASFAMEPVGERVVCGNDLEGGGLYQACKTLHDLHKYPVIHGDPRLANLLVLKSGRFLWTDLTQGYGPSGLFGQALDIEIFALSCLRACQSERKELSTFLMSIINNHDGSDTSWKVVREAIREELGLAKPLFADMYEV
jgi:hypothetical protein